MTIQEVHCGLVGRIAIGEGAEGAILRQGAGGFPEGDGGGQGKAFRSHVVGGDGVTWGIEEQKGERMLAGQADVGFVVGGGGAERRFGAEMKEVTVGGGGLSVVEEGLIAERHGEDLP